MEISTRIYRDGSTANMARNLEIYRKRKGLDGYRVHTFAELGTEYGITRSSVAQLVSKVQFKAEFYRDYGVAFNGLVGNNKGLNEKHKTGNS